MLDSEVKFKVSIIGICCLMLGLVIGYFMGREVQFDSDASVDKIEFMLNNYDDIPLVSTYLDGNTTLEYMSYVYNLKGDTARGMLNILVSGVCLS